MSIKRPERRRAANAGALVLAGVFGSGATTGGVVSTGGADGLTIGAEESADGLPYVEDEAGVNDVRSVRRTLGGGVPFNAPLTALSSSSKSMSLISPPCYFLLLLCAFSTIALNAFTSRLAPPINKPSTSCNDK
jgi:hypothetical protein